MTESQISRYIPEYIKLEIRRRCKFRCIICDEAIIEYHHFDPPFSEATEHSANGITLLCAKHHAHAEKGFITTNEIKQKDLIRRTLSIQDARTEMPSFQIPFTAILGSVFFLGEGKLLEVDGETLLNISVDPSGYLTITALFYDTGGNVICELKNNEIIANASSWDIRWKQRKLTIRGSSHQTFLEMNFHPNSIIHVENLKMSKGTCKMELNSRGKIRILNGAEINLNKYAIAIGGFLKIAEGQQIFTGGVGMVPFPNGCNAIKVFKGEINPSIMNIFGREL
jgi:hypothetical protein